MTTTAAAAARPGGSRGGQGAGGQNRRLQQQQQLEGVGRRGQGAGARLDDYSSSSSQQDLELEVASSSSWRGWEDVIKTQGISPSFSVQCRCLMALDSSLNYTWMDGKIFLIFSFIVDA